MGKFGKWIAGGLGWALFGPLGGILGFALGSLWEGIDIQKKTKTGATTTGDFAMSLLVLVAAVIKADEKVLKSELDHVKKYFMRNFGREAASEMIIMLKDLIKQNIPVQDVCSQIKRNLDYSSRLQLLHFLYGISGADGTFHSKELKLIEFISSHLGISSKDMNSIKSMFIVEIDSSYKILEINKTVNNEEVKKAYRKMAIKYHPDKVSYLGEDFQRIAKEKFQKVNEAYEKIKQERNKA